MGIFIDILGKRFGRLVAIDRISDGPFGKWKFKCDCGNEKIISKQNVTQGKVKSCGCLNKDKGFKQRLQIEGKRFGRLTVKSLKNVKNKSTYWNCICDCGKELVVKGVYLNSGHTKSCGCYQTYKLEKGEAGLNIVYKQYLRHSKRKNRNFEISKERFKEISKMNCFYCGREPSTISKSKSNHSEYVYNGMDRIDSSLGYIESNIVPCCEFCNKMKLDHSFEDFSKQILKISKHLKLGEK